jgi:hypothetical protein
MKFFLVAGLVIVLLGIAFIVRVSAQKSSDVNAPKKADPAIYPEMRRLALHTSRESIGLPGTFAKNQPWGVLMETGYPEGSATLVAMADGSASIYLSSGGGTIGGIGHETIRNAAQQMVQLASRFQPQMKQVTDFPLPQKGETIFYIVTDAGVFTASAPENELGENRHPLSPLFHAGHAVITEFRLLDEHRNKKSLVPRRKFGGG